MKRIKLLVIIPTINKHRSVFSFKRKLKNLAQTAKIDLTICIYKNFSRSLSCNKLKLASFVNTGFTGAVNTALLAHYHEDYHWFFILNDDAVIKSDFFIKLEPFLRMKKYDVISCGVEDLKGRSESFGLSYHKSGLAFPITDSNLIDNEYFCGTAFLISKTCVRRHIEEDGYFFHPLFFAYAEDLEVSVRMKNNEERIYIYPETLVIHHGSQTAKRGSEFQLYQGYRNLLLTIFLHWDLKKIIMNFPLLLAGQLYSIVITLLKGCYKVYPRIIWYFIKNFRTLLFERTKNQTKPPIHNKQWNTIVVS